MKSLIVIPARWGSTRFPGKSLALIAGKTLIERVWLQAKMSKIVDDIIICCDDERIFSAAESFGAKPVMTSTSHQSGTDRIAKTIEKFPEFEIIINLQGDEPLIEPQLIDKIIAQLKKNKKLNLVSAANKIDNLNDFYNENIVKVVLDNEKNALYFSRSPIPFSYAVKEKQQLEDVEIYRHQGIYGFRRDFLLKFSKLKQSNLEKNERLEQLRALQNGEKIKIVICNSNSPGVDTPNQAKLIEKLIKKSKPGDSAISNPC